MHLDARRLHLPASLPNLSIVIICDNGVMTMITSDSWANIKYIYNICVAREDILPLYPLWQKWLLTKHFPGETNRISAIDMC